MGGHVNKSASLSWISGHPAPDPLPPFHMYSAGTVLSAAAAATAASERQEYGASPVDMNLEWPSLMIIIIILP